jgi:starch synthase
VYLLGNNRYFNRPLVYGEYDDGERFLFFCRAALEIPRWLNWKPDIIHCHDWHTAICPSILKADYKNDPLYDGCGSVFTIHNLAYQGPFHESFVDFAGLHNYLIPMNDPFRPQTFNMMTIGIYYADVVTTVSQTYAREILTGEYGCGLENLLRQRQGNLFGILNGIDYDEFKIMIFR